MIVTTTEVIPGKEYAIIGIAHGNTIQTRNIGHDITQGLRSLAGGELKAYVEMTSKARDLATQRMIEDAERQGADAVVMMRYASSTVAAGAAEILAYRTAVKFV